jgi:hypothetical protein
MEQERIDGELRSSGLESEGAEVGGVLVYWRSGEQEGRSQGGGRERGLGQASFFFSLIKSKRVAC